ncbi:hypothetical protein PHYC_02905 [Phycisphaerales bacterium]|nr:hypothetical protein PHYC_02905 [Phycisphaerales bacterium]
MRVASLAMAVMTTATASAQVDVFGGFFVPPGPAGSRLEFDHVPAPGAVGTDYWLSCAIAPMDDETHILVVTFEWQNTPGGEWFSSPDNAVSVRPFETRWFDTGVFSSTDVPWRTALHFWVGGPMVVSGEFGHTSVLPAPASVGLLVSGGGAVLVRRRRN